MKKSETKSAQKEAIQSTDKATPGRPPTKGQPRGHAVKVLLSKSDARRAEAIRRIFGTATAELGHRGLLQEIDKMIDQYGIADQVAAIVKELEAEEDEESEQQYQLAA